MNHRRGRDIRHDWCRLSQTFRDPGPHCCLGRRSWRTTDFMQIWSIPGVLEIGVGATFIAIGVGFAKPFATLVQIVVWGVGFAKPWRTSVSRQMPVAVEVWRQTGISQLYPT